MIEPSKQLQEDRKLLKLLKRVDDHGEGLTEWEIQLVESCLRRLAAGLELTPKQREVLQRVDEEKVK